MEMRHLIFCWKKFMQNIRLTKTVKFIYIFSLFPKQSITSDTLMPHYIIRYIL